MEIIANVVYVCEERECEQTPTKTNPHDTVGTRVSGPCARRLKLLLLIRSGAFFLVILPRRGSCLVDFSPLSGGRNSRQQDTRSEHSGAGPGKKILY